LKVFVSLLIAVGCLLATPMLATAATFTVDSIADEADAGGLNGICLTVGLKCTLRAAIEESNSSSGTKDTIAFASNPFNGQAGDTITIAGSLAITDPVLIDGDGAAQCATQAGQAGPCAEVSGPPSGAALVLEADGVTVEGMAITGATGVGGAGINVDGSESFTAHDNWLGVKLDGTAGANTTGIFLAPNSNGAAIGGINASDRNVFANNAAEGLDILGANGADVSGNYFGVKPDGATAAPNGKDIEVNATAVFEALGNQIGNSLTPEAAGTPACDGGCNVISGAVSSGIDLLGDAIQGETPPVATAIEGNHIGLNAAGTAAVANAGQGVLVGSSKETVIGGGAASANHINGGQYGVFAGAGGVGADDLVVDENLIGLNPAGTATLSPPTAVAIIVDSAGLSGPANSAEITGNRISMVGGQAIQQHGQGAMIVDNLIGRGVGGESLSGGETGIYLYGATIAGNEIRSNVLENAEVNELLIENENNLVVDNTIVGADAAAVRIKGFGVSVPASGNTVGGDSEGEENNISNSGGDAVEIVGEEDADNQVKRNHGAGNGGLFIDLGANGSGNGVSGPNDGIQAPSIGSAKLAGASGSGALPGAEVRVFRKATASPGELESFLGEAVADGSGKWSITYAAGIPGETQIAATQTGFEGTSELAFAKTEPAPKPGDEGSKDQKEKSQSPKKPKTTKPGKLKGGAPETTITKGPRGRTHARKARFKFVSSEKGSKFECKLDRKPFKPCKSPKTYKKLKPGKHVFKVRAVKGKNVDPTPAKRKFRVLK
jgi:CSLREA domain-containing protein